MIGIRRTAYWTIGRDYVWPPGQPVWLLVETQTTRVLGKVQPRGSVWHTDDGAEYLGVEIAKRHVVARKRVRLLPTPAVTIEVLKQIV